MIQETLGLLLQKGRSKSTFRTQPASILNAKDGPFIKGNKKLQTLNTKN